MGPFLGGDDMAMTMALDMATYGYVLVLIGKAGHTQI